MTTIIIKSAIDVPTYHTEEIHSIPEPESLYQKVVRKITKEPRKEHKFVGRVSFDQLKVTILDEVDVKEWMQIAYSHDGREFKKEIQATSKTGITYLFKGCFPINWVPATSEATFCVDCFEIKETK